MSINKKQLKSRKWPVPYFPVGKEVAGRKQAEHDNEYVLYDDNGTQVIPVPGYNFKPVPYPSNYLMSSYVEESSVSAIALPEAVLPGASGITGLIPDGSGGVFGMTTGTDTHLFRCTSDSEMLDMGALCQSSTKASLAIINNKLFIGLATDDKGTLFCRDLNSGKNYFKLIQTFSAGIETIIASSIENKLYGLTGASELFALEIASRQVEIISKIDSDELFSPVLTVDSTGCIYGAARWGKIFCFDPASKEYNESITTAPCIRGREMYNRISALIYDHDSNVIYGGTDADGILFKLNLKTGEMISLGKPFNQPGIRCLVIGNDNCLYGIAGDKCCHLFRYNPQSGDLSDLGMFHVNSPRPWHGYEFDAASMGDGGQIYFGENDRISHLFIYNHDKSREN